ncbi:MAG: hypothetical protein MHM6MM_008645 [Cercozoa sp. M6MM]
MADQVIDNADDGVARLMEDVNEVGQGIGQVEWADVFGRLRSVVTLFREVLDNNDLPNDQANPMVGQLVGFWIRLQEQGRRLLREGGRSEGELEQAIRALIDVSQFARMHVEGKPLWDRCDHSDRIRGAYRETLWLLAKVASESGQSADLVFEALEELKQSLTDRIIDGDHTRTFETAFTALANLTRHLNSSEDDIEQARRVLELFNFLRHEQSGRDDDWIRDKAGVADFLCRSYVHLKATGNSPDRSCMMSIKAALTSVGSSALSQDRKDLQRWVEGKRSADVCGKLLRLASWRATIGDRAIDAHGDIGRPSYKMRPLGSLDGQSLYDKVAMSSDSRPWSTARTINEAVLALCDCALENQQGDGQQLLELLHELLPDVDVAGMQARVARQRVREQLRQRLKSVSNQQYSASGRQSATSGSTSLFWSFWDWVLRFVKGCRDALFAT